MYTLFTQQKALSRHDLFKILNKVKKLLISITIRVFFLFCFFSKWAKTSRKDSFVILTLFKYSIMCLYLQNIGTDKITISLFDNSFVSKPIMYNILIFLKRHNRLLCFQNPSTHIILLLFYTLHTRVEQLISMVKAFRMLFDLFAFSVNFRSLDVVLYTYYIRLHLKQIAPRLLVRASEMQICIIYDDFIRKQ